MSGRAAPIHLLGRLAPLTTHPLPSCHEREVLGRRIGLGSGRVLLSPYSRYGRSRGDYGTAAAMAGLLPWTKQEGLLLWAGSRSSYYRRGDGRRGASSRSGSAAPVVFLA